MKRTTVLALAVALPVVLAPAAGAATEEAGFDFAAEAGAFPVDGRAGHWAPPEQELLIGENSRHWLRVQGESGSDFIGVELAAAGEVPVEVGTYSDVTWQPDPARPMLRVVARGLVCAPVHGSFTVERIERTDGRLTGLDVTVEQHCGAPDAPAFRARVHLRR